MAIRAAVFAGDLVPGQRLVEADLAKTYGMSRGAIRAALFELSHEGVVERVANRGARVRVVSVEEAIQITEVRMAIEALCAEKAAEMITDAQISDLRVLSTRLNQAVLDMNPDEYTLLNHELHDRMVEISGLTVAAEIIARLQARSVRNQFRLSHREGRPRDSLVHFLAIIDALCARDSAAAAAAVRAHLTSVKQLLLQSSS